MRRFNEQQRQALYAVAGGRCESCGADLEDGWHADHVVPFSRGGLTDVTNGRALCSACNLRKGSRMTYQWQQEALAAYEAHALPDFLCVATPGSGKTRWALSAAKAEIDKGTASRVVVVVPTENLKTQWADAAHGLGLRLDPEWASHPLRGEPKDFDGIVATYQQVHSNPEAFRAHNHRTATIGIFDEIHHAGQEKAWGESVYTAFYPCVKRIALSGTPWREDERAIPFVCYEAGKLKADFTYSLLRALDDRVVRFAEFPHFEGRMVWIENGIERRASFADSVTDEESRRRLRTALSAASEWLPRILAEADARLTEIRREGHGHELGLVTACDQEHAKAIAEILHRISGTKPELVISDDPGASETIKRLRVGRERWAVTVKMVSEGTDIPRARVLVYATNVRTRMFFQQFIGRAIRAENGVAEGVAVCFMPSDPDLVQLASEYHTEQEIQLREEIKAAREEAATLRQLSFPMVSTFAPLQATDAAHTGTVFNGETFGPDELEAVERLREQLPPSMRRLPAADLVQALRVMNMRTPAAAVQAPKPEETPAYKVRDRLKTIVHRLVGKYAALSRTKHSHVFTRLRDYDRAEHNACTIEQLDARVALLTEWIARAQG